MSTAIRKFQVDDIPLKVKWINDEKNNKYLHYDLPLREDKTLEWFKTLAGRNDRVDYTITYAGEPVGLIGLLEIDLERKDAEYYICIGEGRYKGKGIAQTATRLLIKEAEVNLKLKNIYLYTEVDNITAQKLFEKCGFINKTLKKNNLLYNGRYIDRYYYNLKLENYMSNVGG